MPEVVLASGDEASGLANMLGTLLAQNVERHPEKYRDFRNVNAAVVFDITDLGSAVTLSFAGDTCTVQEGAVGRPRLRLRTDSATLMGLSQVRIGALGLPNYVDPAGRAVRPGRAPRRAMPRPPARAYAEAPAAGAAPRDARWDRAAARPR